MSVTSVTTLRSVVPQSPAQQAPAPTTPASTLRPISRDSFWRSAPVAVGIGTLAGTAALVIPAMTTLPTRVVLNGMGVAGAATLAMPAVIGGLAASQVRSPWGGVATGAAAGAVTGLAVAVGLGLRDHTLWTTSLVIGAAAGGLAGGVAAGTVKAIRH